MSQTAPLQRTQNCFLPRRLGHANLYVSDYEKAADFYRAVAGFNEAYRQPDNMASFVSNGNTYHDFGLTSTQSKYAKKDQGPGLFHFALELENEVDLVEGYHRAVAAGLPVRSTVDHDVAHSVYFYDPDGNIVEIYADIVRDWHLLRSGIVVKDKPKYVPGVTSAPVAESCYPHDPRLDRIEDAVFHGKRVTHLALVTSDYEAMVRFYAGPIGLRPLAGAVGGNFIILSGQADRGDLTLLRARPGLASGLHHVGVEVWDEGDLARSIEKLGRHGMKVEREIDHPARHCACIMDPDGIRLQFYVNRDWRAATIETVKAEDQPYLF